MLYTVDIALTVFVVCVAVIGWFVAPWIVFGSLWRSIAGIDGL